MKRILLADDDENIRLLLRTALDEPDYVFFEAGDGALAHELARKHRPDLVVLDWTMPVLDGIEVLRRMRADPELQHVPVLLLTARGSEADFRTGRALGVRAHLVKPFSPLELLQAVEEILG